MEGGRNGGLEGWRAGGLEGWGAGELEGHRPDTILKRLEIFLGFVKETRVTSASSGNKTWK